MCVQEKRLLASCTGVAWVWIRAGIGARAIGESKLWHRFEGVSALRTYGQGIGTYSVPLQMGSGDGTPGGTEAVECALVSAPA